LNTDNTIQSQSLVSSASTYDMVRFESLTWKSWWCVQLNIAHVTNNRKYRRRN